ncbi:ribosomal RNA-processing protein 1 homolog, partial [Selaginella moellendorffii]|uniref:ribosomal RNA-processing protein 1 homolog n=1 Tax=Selaginella moellendorffii TaxID=88036 RepID=UPI000D1C751E
MVAKNKSKPLAAGGELEIQSGGLPRRLASVDKKVRDRAVELLASWLECRTSVDEADLRKIWKGLFYCYWHADKAIVQADLAERLASLVQRLPSELALQFFEGYLGTMRREWGGIDHLRMDKFYLLQRKFVSSMFMALRQQRWDKEIVQRYMDALKNRAFLSNDLFPAQGCSMHLADIFLEQLDGVLPEEKEVLGILLEPFYATLALGPDKNVLKRVKERVFDRLLEAARESVDAEGSENKLAEFVTGLPMEKRLFELAASADTVQRIARC